jgi:hypothetical protein
MRIHPLSIGSHFPLSLTALFRFCFFVIHYSNPVRFRSLLLSLRSTPLGWGPSPGLRPTPSHSRGGRSAWCYSGLHKRKHTGIARLSRSSTWHNAMVYATKASDDLGEECAWTRLVVCMFISRAVAAAQLGCDVGFRHCLVLYG